MSLGSLHWLRVLFFVVAAARQVTFWQRPVRVQVQVQVRERVLVLVRERVRARVQVRERVRVRARVQVRERVRARVQVPYDDVGGYSTYISHTNPQYMLVAIGW
ncbi:hypothetical protein [Edaphobacter aggregans]|uniref:hypothetical protein n=1 Tax=Edaphobacter aggregans TaxID=570835 RepID=UPI0012F75E34|nr:hypothetical protein [Edaphobacter aggregans]